jgi:hypothetical protein
VCSDLIAYDTKHAHIDLYDMYVAASDEKFNVHTIPSPLSFHSSLKKNRKQTEINLYNTSRNIALTVSLLIGTRVYGETEIS